LQYYQDAASHGVFPSAYQRGTDYKAEWNLRAKPWWRRRDLSSRLKKLVDELEKKLRNYSG